jgi:hypothetical protein
MSNRECSLLDYLRAAYGLRNDRQLSEMLDLAPPIISKIRGKSLPITASILLAIHEETGIGLRALRFLAGDYRDHTGRSAEVLSAEACAAQAESPEMAEFIRHAVPCAGVSLFKKSVSPTLV